MPNDSKASRIFGGNICEPISCNCHHRSETERQDYPGPRCFPGLYIPRIYDRKLDHRKWHEGYVQTYLERDIRQLVNLADLRTFESFLKLCAGMSGQLLNYASIANAIGISQPTVKRWISLLETSGIVYILPPYYEIFSRRIIKSPKIYFTDTGLLCFLLSIRKPDELQTHPLFGAIFETFIVADLFKRVVHLGELPPFYYWRDRSGKEVDLIVDFGQTVLPVEIKSSRTFSSSFRSNLQKWIDLSQGRAVRGLVIYAGERIVGRGSRIPVVPWWSV